MCVYLGPGSRERKEKHLVFDLEDHCLSMMPYYSQPSITAVSPSVDFDLQLVELAGVDRQLAFVILYKDLSICGFWYPWGKGCVCVCVSVCPGINPS